MRRVRNPQIKFICQNCGHTVYRLMNTCTECGQRDTFIEETISQPARPKNSKINTDKINLVKISDIKAGDEKRMITNLPALDRVLGGGIVAGSVVLVGGDPGIGKSTLMMQLADGIRSKTILYVSGEESTGQIKLRAKRISFGHQNFLILSETNFLIIDSVIENISPDVVIVDSIQTIFTPIIDSSPGSISQLRESTAEIIKIAKEKNIAFFLIGHITKDGAIAGPKILEHMVDTVLEFSGEKNSPERSLSASKNRFGPTNEIAEFNMTGKGLVEV